MAEKKEKLIKEFLSSNIKVGDNVIVKKKLLGGYSNNPERDETVTVKEVYDHSIKVSNTENYLDDVVLEDGQYQRSIFHVGANPFPNKCWRSTLRTTNFDLACMLNLLGYSIIGEKPINNARKAYIYKGVDVPEVNDNPYIYDKDGNKQYYQRDYCWTLEQEQLFIESIYQSINCGMIVVRKRSFNYIESEIDKGNTEVAFWDIVDGKQRLHCLIRFIFDEFKDLHGNYFSDLSERAKRQFEGSSVLTYGELEENATDEDVIATFLGVNFTGVPMSQEHIDYVKEIQKKL